MGENVEKRCTKCGGETIKYGTVNRIIRTKNRETEQIRVQRFKCKLCGVIFRDLPENVIQFKQYERDVVDGVKEGLIGSDILGFEDYPCEMTMKRWRAHK